MSNNVVPAEMANNELFHLGLHCLQNQSASMLG